MKSCERPTEKYPNGLTGTESGERLHRKLKEEACEECREARNRGSRERRYEQSPWLHPHEVSMECEKRTKKFPNGKTGLSAGFGAHRRAGETPCEPCLEANRKYNARKMRERRDK